MKIKVNDLKVGMRLRQSVFHTGRVLIEKGQELNEKHIERLKNFSIFEVNIESEEEEKMRIIRENEAQVKNEFVEVYKETVEKTKAVFADGIDKGIDTKAVSEVIEDTLSGLGKNTDIFLTLLEMREEENYLYEHSIKSSIIAMSIGVKLAYTKEKLELLGKAALLHDIGMFKVDNTILNKEGKLSKEEVEAIRLHTEIGAKLLENEEEEVRLAALYHHERVDGSGYPRGLVSHELTEITKIVSIADLYAALISDRVYREAKDPKDAIKYLMSVAGKQVDTEIVKKLLENMSLFAMGSYVRLSNGLRARVIKATDNPFRPIIDIEENGELTRMDLNQKENSLIYIMRLIV